MPDFWFFLEVLVGGLLSGTMYSLVALGFVLIYKASSVFNFAQGAMVFFAVLSFVGFMELGLPFWAALPVTVGLMVLVGMAHRTLRPASAGEPERGHAADGHDRPRLRHRGHGAARLGRRRAAPRSRHPGRADQLARRTRPACSISQLDITAAVVAGIMVAALALLFSRTKVGRGLARGRRRPRRGAVDRHSA